MSEVDEVNDVWKLQKKAVYLLYYFQQSECVKKRMNVTC